MTHRHGALLVGVAAALWLTAAGCAKSDERSGPLGLEQGYIDGASIFSDQEFQITAEQLRADAEIATAECMNSKGFDYIGSDYSLQLNNPIGYDQVSGVTDEEFAERWGFGIMSPADSDVVSDEDNPSAGLPPEPTPESFLDAEERVAYEEALYGTNEGNPGCEFPAHAEYRRFGFEYGERFEEIAALRRKFSVSDEVRTRYRDWSACMADEGYVYISPLETLVGYQELLPTRRVDFEEQRQSAIATVDCGGSVLNMLPDELAEAWAEFVASLGA